MRNIFILLLTIICLQIFIAKADSLPLQELSITLNELQHVREVIRLKKAAAWEEKKQRQNQLFYNNLKKALNKESLEEIHTQLVKIKPETRASIAIDIVTALMEDSEKISPDTYLFKYKSLELKNTLLILTNYIIFITKIVEAIATKISKTPTDEIDIFTDEIFNDPLILYFLLSSLLNRDYQSIHIHILSPLDKTFADLDNLLEYKKNNYSISKYKTIDQFLHSGNKIDIYLTESTISGSSAKKLQCINKKAPRIKGDFRLLLAEHSKISNANYILASKDTDHKTIELIASKLENPNQDTHTKDLFDCKELKYCIVNLADVIYLSNKKQDRNVLLFELRYDKGNPIIKHEREKIITEKEKLTIIESLLTFTDYADLYGALARNYFVLKTTDVDKIALFKVDPQVIQINHTNDNLNKSKSTLTEIVRAEKITTKQISRK